MKAVVMAGGFGTRIQPLTSSVPKPMIPVMNKPMMGYIIESLKNAGIVDIVVLLYFKPEVIKSYFGDGSEIGVNITYVLPDDDYGTAGAVKQAQQHLDERFIIVSGDLITDFKIQEILGFHEVKDSKATITLTSVPDPLQFGVVITDKESKILRFLEKPGWGDVFSDTINTGIYVFEPEILNFIPENTNFDFSKDLFPKLMASGIDIFGYNAKGYWRDVGNPDSYREALQDIIAGQVALPLSGTLVETETGKCYIGEGSKADGVKFEGTVVLGRNTVVEKGSSLTNTCIGDDCFIGADSKIETSIIWDKVRVGSKSAFKNTVICNEVIIGKHVLGQQGFIIAENTEVGNNVVFEKDVMVWPDKQIEEGSILSSNLIWGDKFKKSIFEGGKVNARTNVELSADIAAKLGSALGSQLPVGSRVLLSRDYHRASRMIKRCFLGGLLSTGVNAVDINMSALPVMRHKLSMFGEVAGVYFRQSENDSSHTEIVFYDDKSALIDAGHEKNIERSFFRENFRRAAHDEIGEIYEQPMVHEFYKESFLKNLDIQLIRTSMFKLVVDLTNGTTDSVYPALLNRLNIDAVILNAYHDEKRLSRTMNQAEVAVKEISDIVKVKDADIGFMIRPHGSMLKILSDKGELLKPDKALMLFLKLMDLTVKEKVKVYIPAYAPSVLDNKLSKVEVVRGKYASLKAEFVKSFYFKGSLNNTFTFIDNGTHSDAMFASCKLLEMLAKADMKMSDVMKQIPDYNFVHSVINCPLESKGFLMRKMSEEAMDKDASFLDGIKITFGDKGWVHMVPDQYSANVHLYVESSTGNWKELLEEYKEKINGWLEEQ